MNTNKSTKQINAAREKIQQAKEHYEELLENDKLINERKVLEPPKFKMLETSKGTYYKKDPKYSIILTKTIFYTFCTFTLWIVSIFLFMNGISSPVRTIISLFAGVTTLIVTLLTVIELATKSLPLLFFKNNEKSLKNLLKISMFTLTGKIKQFYIKPSVDADFNYNTGLYVVDDGAKYWDGNYYNSYYVEGLPPPLKLKRTSNVQEYYKSVEKIKNALNDGEGWEDVKESDIDNLICFSHSAKQLGEYKKDKIFSEMHKSKDGDKMTLAVIGFATIGFICMVVVVVLILIFGN